MATKAVRFNKSEEEAIKDFLKKNPFLDFSTLARIAISKFIENPELNLIPTTNHLIDKQEMKNEH
jgi:hypothetical protein